METNYGSDSCTNVQSTQYQDPNPPLSHPQPDLPAQKIASTGVSKPFHPPGPSAKASADIDQSKETSNGSNKRKNEEAHVGRENIAGRRVLTKRSGSKRDLFPYMDEEEDEEERRVERSAAAVEEFDPTAPVCYSFQELRIIGRAHTCRSSNSIPRKN